jgi:1-acyl-sn-glycerol-3-phosphate acyltransferase
VWMEQAWRWKSYRARSRSFANLSRLEYDHFNVTISQRLVVGTLKGITSLICRIDDAELKLVPKQGPLILYTNHVNILEIPIIYTHLQPRKVHGMLLAERWENPLLRWMLQVTETIPIHRGEADILAIRKGLKILEQGEILIIAPEGTRSHDGKLQPAHPGVVLLALHSHAPLMPVAYYGAERYKGNLSRLKRTDFHLRVGKPFCLETRGEKVTRQVRQKMLVEMMYQLAAVLPPEYRGHYADLSSDTKRYIDFN